MRRHREQDQRRAVFACEAMAGRSHSERDLSAPWNDGLFRGPIVLSDGRTVEIVQRGT